MMNYAGIGGLGTTELIVILGICVLLFGAAKIPQLARSVGKSISEFKKGIAEGTTDGGGAKDASVSQPVEEKKA